MPTLLQSNTSSGMQFFASKNIHLSGFPSSSILQHIESLSSKSHGKCSCGVIFTTPCRLRILCSMFSRCYCSPLWRILSSSSHRIPPDSLTAFSNKQNTSNRSRTLNGDIFTSISEWEPILLKGIKKKSKTYISTRMWKDCSEAILDIFLSFHYLY